MLWDAAYVSFLSYSCVCRCALSHFPVDVADTWLHGFYETHFTVWERSKENPTCDKAYGLYHYFPVLLLVAEPYALSGPDIRFFGRHPVLVNLLSFAAPAKMVFASGLCTAIPSAENVLLALPMAGSLMIFKFSPNVISSDTLYRTLSLYNSL